MTMEDGRWDEGRLRGGKEKKEEVRREERE